MLQFGVMIIGLFIFGNLWGISGVAIAVNLMILIGIIIMFWQARSYVRFSILRLFGSPFVALVTGLLFAYLAILILNDNASYWVTGTIKSLVFSIIYMAIMLFLEHKEIPIMMNYARKIYQGNRYSA